MNIKKRLYLPCAAFLGFNPLPTRNQEQKQNCNRAPRDCTATLFLANSEIVAEEPEIADMVDFFPNEAPPLPDLEERGGTWVMISPYGRHAHSQGMQVFEKADAQALVNEFKKWWNIGSRKMGLPWYVGHPDHPQFANRDTDTRAYGRIKKLEARDDGFWGKVFFSAAGKELVNERAYHGHSPNWSVTRKNGAYHPISLRSVGFTNMPNISVAPILHANEKNSRSDSGSADPTKNQNSKETMITKIKELLLSVGKVKPGKSEDEDVFAGVEALANENSVLQEAATTITQEAEKLNLLANAAIANLGARLRSLMDAKNEKAGDDGKKLTVGDLANAAGIEESTMSAILSGEIKNPPENRLTALAKLLGVSADSLMANEAMIAAEENFANERKAHAELIVEKAVTEGRVAIADKDSSIETLANSEDFDAAVERIANATPTIKTQSVTEGLEVSGNGKGSDERKMLANEILDAGKAPDWDTAWSMAKRAKPELFKTATAE